MRNIRFEARFLPARVLGAALTGYPYPGRADGAIPRPVLLRRLFPAGAARVGVIHGVFKSPRTARISLNASRLIGRLPIPVFRHCQLNSPAVMKPDHFVQQRHYLSSGREKIKIR